MKMVCVGDCGIDRYLAPTQQDSCGGITFNFAHHATRQFNSGWDISIISALGNDAESEMVSHCLKQEETDLHITKLDGRTPVQTINIKPDGEKEFVQYHEGVLARFIMGIRDTELIRQSDLLMAVHFQQIDSLFSSVMDCPSQGLRAVDFADYAIYPSLPLLDVYAARFDIGFFGLVSSQKKLIAELRDFARAHNKVIVVTLAADGSLVFNGDKVFTEPAAAVREVVDTTGAGDSFAAGFLSRFCEDRNIQAAMERGAACAAETICQLGALVR